MQRKGGCIDDDDCNEIKGERNEEERKRTRHGSRYSRARVRCSGGEEHCPRTPDRERRERGWEGIQLKSHLETRESASDRETVISRSRELLSLQ